MLHISRKIFVVPFEHVYFGESNSHGRYEAKIIRYTHRLKPSRQLQKKETVHLQLQREENEIFEEIPQDTKEMLSKLSSEEYIISVMINPSYEEIKQFQYFHNQLAKEKNVPKVNRSHMQTLKLLKDKQALVMTKVENKNSEPICYRVYIVDGTSVLLHFVSSTSEPHTEEEDSANLYLCWENIKMFNKLGFTIYDFGGASADHPIFRINEIFGGKIVSVYSGFVAKTQLSKKIVQIDEWRKRKQRNYMN